MPDGWNGWIDWSLVQAWALKIGAALLILIVTHFIARSAQWALARVLDRVPLLDRHRGAGEGESIGTQVSALAYWLIWLVGLVAALAPLGLDQVVAPVSGLTAKVFAFIPNLLGAILILAFGLLIAAIARKIVETALSALNPDGWLARLKGDAPAGDAAAGAVALARGLGLAVYILIVLPVATAALQALGLESLSGPLAAILQSIARFLPRLAAAAGILVIGWLIARQAGNWTGRLLDAMGLDSAAEGSGLLPRGIVASRVAGIVAHAAILLAAAIAAVDVLEIPSLERMLEELLSLGGHVLFGTIIIIAGVVLARFLRGVAGVSGDGGFAPAIIHHAVIALATAMGLRFMGLADGIVNLAFGLILGSAAVACAVAFGLGGRETAHQLLERWTTKDR
jgi:hypothetical protein